MGTSSADAIAPPSGTWLISAWAPEGHQAGTTQGALFNYRSPARAHQPHPDCFRVRYRTASRRRWSPLRAIPILRLADDAPQLHARKAAQRSRHLLSPITQTGSGRSAATVGHT